MKIDEIQTIVKLMSENDLTEFRIECEDMHLCLKRGSNQSAVIPQNILAAPAVAAPAMAPAVVSAPAVAPAAAEEAVPAVSGGAVADASKVIESPIVGTFYRASAPGADPMVKVGSKVDAETVVCIIEAMKVMNEIKAEKTGVIKEILVENGQPVEFGQPIFVLE